MVWLEVGVVVIEVDREVIGLDQNLYFISF